MIPCTGAGNIQKVSFGVVDLLKVSIVSNSFYISGISSLRFTLPCHEAQVDFGYVGRIIDDNTIQE
ncbi:MAG: hypothetical protein HZA08_12450 [Nitrospirae bacterium]|nr:hypothetical protein [Nitrospirota bacterium]